MKKDANTCTYFTCCSLSNTHDYFIWIDGKDYNLTSNIMTADGFVYI